MVSRSVRQAIKMLASGLRPRPRSGKENRAARLRCKRPKGHEGSCPDGCVEFDDDTAWLAPGPTDPGGDVVWSRADEEPRGSRTVAHWTTLTAPRGRVRRKQGPGPVVRMMQTAVVPKLDDPDGVPIAGLPGYRVKRIDVGTSPGKSRGHDAFTMTHEDAGRSWTSPSAWTPEAWNAAWRGRSGPPLPTTAWIADSFCQTELLELDTPTLIEFPDERIDLVD